MIKYFLMASLVLSCAFATGCSSYKGDAKLMSSMNSGEFGLAREGAIATSPSSPKDKSFILGRTKVLIASMADGVPQSTEGNVDELYDLLRTQGVNEGLDVGIASVLTTEANATVWKGEPFEQAMGYAYIAAFDGTQGGWGNVRAAASNSIFLIRDFSDSIERGEDILENEEVPANDQEQALANREAIIADTQERSGDEEEEGLEFDLVESDFELGYMLQAIASDQLDDTSERDEHLRALQRISPRFRDMTNQIRRGSYNTVVFASYGLGPEKYGDGYDQVIEMYRPRTPSGDERLAVRTRGRAHSFPVATDINRLALDTRWTNLEGMRRAKSIVGTAMVGTGAVIAARADSVEEALVGGFIALGGLLAKESAKADTRHCEILPQRTYIALLNIAPGTRSRVEFEIEGIPQTRLVLPDVPGPARESDDAVFHYLRLSSGTEAWRTNATPVYANDHSDWGGPPTLPYILGGRCMRTPTPDLMSGYHAAGLPSGVTFDELMEMYRDEGIVIADLTPGLELGRHIAEGGNALYTPSPSSAGFARIYCQEHSPYQPKGGLVRTLMDEIGATAQ